MEYIVHPWESGWGTGRPDEGKYGKYPLKAKKEKRVKLDSNFHSNTQTTHYLKIPGIKK